jgi:hypothetical protein
MATSTKFATKTETEPGDKPVPNLDPNTSLLRVLVARHRGIRRHLRDLADAISEREHLERSGESSEGEGECDLHRAEYRIAEAFLAILASYHQTGQRLHEECHADADDDEIPF